MKCQWEGKGHRCPNEAGTGGPESIFCRDHKDALRYIGVVCDTESEAESASGLYRSNGYNANVYQHRFVIVGPTNAPAHYFQNSKPQVQNFWYEDVLVALIEVGQLVRIIEEGTQMVMFLHPILSHCPKCGTQHVDHLEESGIDWAKKPHKRHLCHHCGEIYTPLGKDGRPITYDTIGVKSI